MISVDGFKVYATAFCRCGHMMEDSIKGFVTCVNSNCRLLGKDYRIAISLEERKTATQ